MLASREAPGPQKYICAKAVDATVAEIITEFEWLEWQLLKSLY